LLSLANHFQERKNRDMHITQVLALIFALVFGLVAFGFIVNMNTDIAALTTGGFQSLIALFPAFWMLLVGFVVVAAAIVAAKMIG
jgi:hypothetical protein